MFGAKYSRLKFWIWSIILFIIAIPILIAKNILKDSVNADTILIIGIAGILISAIWMNTLANRIRDYGDNPWIALFSIIPLANVGLALYYGIAKSNIKEVPKKIDTNSLSSAVYNHSKDIINGIKPAINEYKETHTSSKENSQNNNISIDESKIYEDIMNEIEQDNKVKSTWARALAQSEGNKDKAESLYINMRFEELKYEQSYHKEKLNLSEEIKEIKTENEVETRKDSSSKTIVFLIILISVLLCACIVIFPLIYFNLNKDDTTTISSSLQSDNTSIQNNANVQKNDNVSNSTNSITSKTTTNNIKEADKNISTSDNIFLVKSLECKKHKIKIMSRYNDDSIYIYEDDVLLIDNKPIKFKDFNMSGDLHPRSLQCKKEQLIIDSTMGNSWEGHYSINLDTFKANLLDYETELKLGLVEKPIIKKTKMVVNNTINEIPEYPSLLVEDNKFNKEFKKLLGDDYNLFLSNLTVSSPMEDVGTFYLGSGMNTHSGGMEEAIFTINKSTSNISAAILTTDYKTNTKKIKYYGDITFPIEEWAKSF